MREEAARETSAPGPLQSRVRQLDGTGQVNSGQFALVASCWNGAIMQALIEAALETLVDAGVDEGDILLVRVPGAFEIPQAVQAVLAQCRGLGAVVTLGCVIRGETPHFEYVAGECARGVAAIARTSAVPVVLGVLTTDTPAQARARSQPGPHNKGREAASAALALQRVMAQLKAGDEPK